MTFYSCFFVIWILVPILLLVSKQDNELLTVPIWETTFLICLVIQLFDYKPYSSLVDNFTHTYSQFILLFVLMTGTIISAKGTFKTPYWKQENQAIRIIILYTILTTLVLFIASAVNFYLFGRKVYKMFKTIKLKKLQREQLRLSSQEKANQKFELIANQGDLALKDM